MKLDVIHIIKEQCIWNRSAKDIVNSVLRGQRRIEAKGSREILMKEYSVNKQLRIREGLQTDKVAAVEKLKAQACLC